MTMTNANTPYTGGTIRDVVAEFKWRHADARCRNYLYHAALVAAHGAGLYGPRKMYSGQEAALIAAGIRRMFPGT